MKSLRFTAACAAAVLLAAVHVPAAFAQERIELPWAQLAPALNGRVVSTVLVDGTALRGRVLDVSADALQFEATKTSNRKLHPKGEISLSRSQVTAFSYKERHGRWRVAGTAIGAGAGYVPAAILCKLSECAGGYQNSAQWAAVSTAILGAGTAVGYLAGRAADTHETMVVVEKE